MAFPPFRARARARAPDDQKLTVLNCIVGGRWCDPDPAGWGDAQGVSFGTVSAVCGELPTPALTLPSPLRYGAGRSPQVVMATAQVLFQRFWFVTSLKHFGIKVRLPDGLATQHVAAPLRKPTHPAPSLLRRTSASRPSSWRPSSRSRPSACAT